MSLLHFYSTQDHRHGDMTYYSAILRIEQKSILRLKREKYIVKKILSYSLKPQSCKCSTAAADTAKHVCCLFNIRHASISTDTIIYIAGTAHML